MLSCTLALLSFSGGTYDGPPLPKLSPEITRAEIEHHLRTLASDAMLGRATGSKESVTAAHYLAEVLEAYGIAPAGDDGTYLQNVHFTSSKLRGTPSLVLATRDGSKPAAVYETDWRSSPTPFAKRTLSVVVAHDAAAIPKEGLADKALFLDQDERAKQRDSLKTSGHERGTGIGLLVVPRGKTPPGRSMPTLAVEGALLEAFRAGTVQTLTLEVAYEELQAFNVVGLLRGTGPGANKAIVLSAHYDHLGEVQNAPAGADHVNNGADDDASGCSVVLELAGALAQEGKHEHSIVFLLATGEEIGLVGTNYQLEHPAVPLADTLANLNFEMLGRPDPLVGGAGKMWLTGWDESNLGAALAAAGIPVAIDPRPTEHFYERSDNIAYVMKGVVGQTFSTYNMHTDYHTAADEADKIDFEHLTQCAKTALAAVDLVANGKVVPAFSAKAPEKKR
jgi:Peptidase family M28